MDISELKKQSDLSYDRAIAKRNALEKANSRLVVVDNEHLFRADPETICLVSTLKELYDSFCVLDTNNNPVEINDPKDFLSVLVTRNQESINAYQQVYKTFTRRDK